MVQFQLPPQFNNKRNNMKNINKIVAKYPQQNVSSSGLINALYKETSYGRTENEALTFIRSGSSLLDFYAQAGAMRNNQEKALDLFKKAFSENQLYAIRILFYLRDVRGGQGERELFRNCLEWLGDIHPNIFSNIIKYVSEYGRWDDLFFENEECFKLIKKQIEKDLENDNPSLLAKWLPTINASSPSTKEKAKLIAKSLGMDEIEYRKKIREIRKKIKVVEEKMSSNEWDKIDYSSVPSRASMIYKNAFRKHDEERYEDFIDKAEKGEKKINASTLYPYEIYDRVEIDYSKTLEALWNQLPDYTQGKNALVVADVSGSMNGRPMSVSVSLALYFAERNKGQFKDYFITFSRNPRLQKVQGTKLIDRMNSIERADWDGNTDIEAVFKMILDTANKNNVSSEQMPETIYIISDMEFDCVDGIEDKTIFEDMKEKYYNSGYKIPNIVFWNVDARSGNNLPVQTGETGVAMVSGFSPVIFKIAIENKTPEQVMLDTINSERYKNIEL